MPPAYASGAGADVGEPFPTQQLLGALLASPVRRKRSELANVPHDMFDFCTAAEATECLYLPPDVYFPAGPGSLPSFDPVIDQPTCGPLGGIWD